MNETECLQTRRTVAPTRVARAINYLGNAGTLCAFT
jgi:hypothetical protein